MRKIILYCFFGLIIFFVASCNSLTSTPAWTKIQYVDENGNMPEEYYVEYNREIKATYSNGVDKDKQITLENLRFSRITGLTFSTSQNDIPSPANANEEISFTVTTRNDGRQFWGGVWDTNAIVALPYSFVLLDSIKRNGTKVSLKTDKITITFNFPNGFNNIWESPVD